MSPYSKSARKKEHCLFNISKLKPNWSRQTHAHTYQHRMFVHLVVIQFWLTVWAAFNWRTLELCIYVEYCGIQIAAILMKLQAFFDKFEWARNFDCNSAGFFHSSFKNCLFIKPKSHSHSYFSTKSPTNWIISRLRTLCLSFRQTEALK